MVHTHEQRARVQVLSNVCVGVARTTLGCLEVTSLNWMRRASHRAAKTKGRPSSASGRCKLGASVGREGGAIAHVACAARRDLVKHRVLLSQTKMALVEPKGCALGFVLFRCLSSCVAALAPSPAPVPRFEHVAGVDADMKLVEVLNVRLLEG